MKKPTALQPEFGYSCNLYFHKELQPAVLRAGQKAFNAATRYEQHTALEYIFIRSGTGILHVNEVSFPIQTGDAAIFSSFHFHRFIPHPGEELVVDYFQITIGSFLYMLANPYRPMPNVGIEEKNSRLLHFTNTERGVIQALYDNLRMQDLSQLKSGDHAVFLAMDLMGAYERCSTESAVNHAFCF